MPLLVFIPILVLTLTAILAAAVHLIIEIIERKREIRLTRRLPRRRIFKPVIIETIHDNVPEAADPAESVQFLKTSRST